MQDTVSNVISFFFSSYLSAVPAALVRISLRLSFSLNVKEKIKIKIYIYIYKEIAI